jgi:hypothetical protein
MILTNHALTGVLLGLAMPSPWLTAPVALASHFALDAVPHFGHREHHLNSRRWLITGIVDGAFTLAVFIAALVVWPRQWLQIAVGFGFAILPDLFYVPEAFVKRSLTGGWGRFHSFVQWGENPTGWLVDAAWMVLVASWLYALAG